MLYKDINDNEMKGLEIWVSKKLKELDSKPTYSELAEMFDTSDISIYKAIQNLGLESNVRPTRKKLQLKLDIIDTVLAEPYEHDMTSLLKKFDGTNHNQISRFLEDEGVRELVPTKYGKIEHKVLTFLHEHSGEYSTQEVIDVLNLNRKTFYKIYNSHPEEHNHFRKVSKKCKQIKDLIDETPEKLTPNEIAKELNISVIVVKNSIDTLGYKDKVKFIKSITSRVKEFIKENPNKFTVKEIADELDLNYNTVYKVIQRHKLETLILA